MANANWAYFSILFTVPDLNQSCYDTSELRESEFSDKDLKAMKEYAIAFFLKDIEKLKLFIKRMQENFEQCDLTFVLKMFVLNRNMVFNMAEYMKRQSELAEEHVKSQGAALNSEERRAILNKWIDENAKLHRKHTIFNQLYCIDEMASEIIPEIEKAVKE
jgi:inorganic pyrophosphatase/exopolyphosphatase